jgi:hypothetical protein
LPTPVASAAGNTPRLATVAVISVGLETFRGAGDDCFMEQAPASRTWNEVGHHDDAVLRGDAE